MKTRDELLNTDDVLDKLLRQAAPRPRPAEQAARAARETLRGEWRAQVAGRRRRRAIVGLALAASVTLALSLLLLQGAGQGPATAAVATIARVTGTAYVVLDDGLLRPLAPDGTLAVGDTLVTEPGAGLALQWSDGASLRIDADTRVTVLSPAALRLDNGRVYYDSSPWPGRPAGPGAPRAGLEFHIDRVVVSHLGTAYMLAYAREQLAVSVRDGKVSVRTPYDSLVADSGERLLVHESRRTSKMAISVSGDEWQWAEEIAPSPDFDQRSILELLDWVAQETGYELRFVGADTERIARTERLVGNVDLPPLRALHYWLRATSLEAQVREGTIVIEQR